MRSGVPAAVTTIAYGVLLAAVPAALVHHLGLPDLQLPSAGAVRASVHQPLTSGFILALVSTSAHGGSGRCSPPPPPCADTAGSPARCGGYRRRTYPARCSTWPR
jgi:hypothetical protein